ncbi:MAG TPA: GyrI-like domain-containing protein [Candidatus Binatia bacterium]|nr:GyrI-like domain-containing protein [Candidatus Binatia bacterium]
MRFARAKEMLLAGLSGSYTIETRGKIPAQWERFAPSIGKVPGQIGQVCYGVCWNVSPERGFDYLTGVEVTDTKGLPSEFATVRLVAREYAVFAHRDHVSAIDRTVDRIWKEWVPQAGLKVASAPCFERYGEEFDPQTGMGGMEVWIPLDA